MVTRIQKWGNSQGLRLGRAVMADAGLSVGDEVDVTVRDGTLILTPVRRVRGGADLGDLVRRIPRGYRHGRVVWGVPKGREAW